MYLKYKRPTLKPVVGFFLSKESKEAVSGALTQVNGVLFLHIIDNAIPRAAAAVIKLKRKEYILKPVSF